MQRVAFSRRIVNVIKNKTKKPIAFCVGGAVQSMMPPRNERKKHKQERALVFDSVRCSCVILHCKLATKVYDELVVLADDAEGVSHARLGLDKDKILAGLKEAYLEMLIISRIADTCWTWLQGIR